MTAQITDSFLLQVKKFSMIGDSGESFFDPLSYKLDPKPIIKSCWRVYVCTYKTHVRDESPPGPNGLQPGRDASGEEVDRWIASTFRQDNGIFDEQN